MIRISALLFLFIIQIMLIFAGIAVFFFLRLRKLSFKEKEYRKEIEKLMRDAAAAARTNDEVLHWQEMFNNLEKKFEAIKNANLKLQETVKKLLPEAEKSEEYKKAMAEFEKYNMELDKCLGTLEKENKDLDEKIISYEDEVKGLSEKLSQSISKSDFDALKEEKDRLEKQVEDLKEQLEKKTEEYEKLDKNYIWLEKEYNALYESTESEKGA